ncbi:MAG: lipid-A-disaccharide synthase [Verrucomicrobia bacterium]|nr:MAG: lipid-A-disaccharide synthase [Verrucomicrobiota bacterium]
MKLKTLMFIAGEPSGDVLAAELVKALKESPEVQALAFPPKFFGAGGRHMAEAGVDLALDLTQHSVIGLSEALAEYLRFKRIFDRLFQLAIEREPEVIVCVDFSGFNRRFARAIKKYVRARRGTFLNWDPKIVQYVSPQVWASRPARAYQLARDVDLLLTILPFEKDWYAARVPRLHVEFVGHPIVDRYASRLDGLRATRPSGTPVLLLLPGSRDSELKRHLPVMFASAQRIQNQASVFLRMVLPTERLAELAKPKTTALPRLHVQVGNLAESLAEATVAIASTGTVTVECAYIGVPTVAIYKAAWSDYLIASQILRVKHLAMPNLLAGEEIYPEFIQHGATPDNIARATLELLNHPERRSAMKARLAQVAKSLGEQGASRRAAKGVLSLLDQKTVPIRAALAD